MYADLLPKGRFPPTSPMRARNRDRSARAGFTLIELLIAITVLLVAVVSTFVTQVSAHNLMRTSRETSVAVADLQTAMEQALLLTVDQMPLSTSAFASGQPIAAFTDQNLRGETIVATYPDWVAGTDVPDPLQVVLTLRWNDFHGRVRTLRFASMKTR